MIYKIDAPIIPSICFPFHFNIHAFFWFCFCRYRLESYAKDSDIYSYRTWLSDQCSVLKKQNDSSSCLRWLREFTEAGAFLPIEEIFLSSNRFFLLKEGFKLCNELRQVIQIASNELLPVWRSVSVLQLVHSDPIFSLLCRIKITFRNVFQVCQTDSGTFPYTYIFIIWCVRICFFSCFIGLLCYIFVLFNQPQFRFDFDVCCSALPRWGTLIANWPFCKN